MKKLYSVFCSMAAAVVLPVTDINVNAQQGGNGLWQALGSDTVTTNRQVAVTKNMTVKGQLTADSIKTKNGNLTVTDSVTIKTYVRMEDSVRVLGPLRIGDSSLVIDAAFAPTGLINNIYTNTPDLYLQSGAQSPYNTIINYKN